ncbi:MAG: hypothetical protein CFE40_08795 [Burkholderiales bacterium PBB1]|nr:MAG: hypothetical protein CFE40_08795 [Burkholderiales bacterium PBB1]
MSENTTTNDTPSPEETASKDAFFAQLAAVSDAMIAAHGRDFAMGAHLLAARYIAESDARTKAAVESLTSPTKPVLE